MAGRRKESCFRHHFSHPQPCQGIGFFGRFVFLFWGLRWKHSVMGIALGLGMERICTTPPSPRFLGGISRLPQLCCVSVSGTRCFFFGDIIGTRGRIMHIGHDTRRLFFLGNTESRQLGRVVTCGLGYNSQPSGPPLFQFMVWLHLLFCHFFIGCLRRG